MKRNIGTCDYVILAPGRPSSNVQSFNISIILNYLSSIGKRVILLGANSCNIYAVRNSCIKNQDNGCRKNQKPFEGMIDHYEKMIWIDSDNLITVDALQRLLAHDVDIVAAWYKQGAGTDSRVTCGAWDRASGCGVNKAIPFSIEDMQKLSSDKSGLIEVDYCGFGLIVIKHGVFEKMDYPWFSAGTYEWVEDGVQMAEIDTDDAAWCFKAQSLGFKIYVDPNVRVMHEKLAQV